LFYYFFFWGLGLLLATVPKIQEKRAGYFVGRATEREGDEWAGWGMPPDLDSHSEFKARSQAHDPETRDYGLRNKEQGLRKDMTYPMCWLRSWMVSDLLSCSLATKLSCSFAKGILKIFIYLILFLVIKTRLGSAHFLN